MNKGEEIKNITNDTDNWMRSVIVFLKAHGCAIQFNTARNLRESFNRQLNNWKDQIRLTLPSMNPPVEQRVVRKLQIAAKGKENELTLPGHEFWLSSL